MWRGPAPGRMTASPPSTWRSDVPSKSRPSRNARSPVVVLELVDRVEKAPVRMGAEKRRIRPGIHRAHLLQSPRAPVHANEIDALRPGADGICPNVEKITIRRTLRATREPDETD